MTEKLNPRAAFLPHEVIILIVIKLKKLRNLKSLSVLV